ncbi:hypothetical protein FisN_10Lu387 [Fistulifera solaris]|jgi:hypothetical protein|uniref:Uncharacterized protein n=1 Tax=Fistulifera solaris TaxID=1519565 RepID=A0A1Z5JUH2_FISSO|nr:hypothetical protein FisN_10Lu387 [Fistulifera solaris]|eukprot:GAX17670.1 hypothetical protein FisN_10Lu387 [Fistulifera solaris]
MSIWRNNHTIICVTPLLCIEYKNYYVSFKICREIDEHPLHCAIFGESHDAVAETATFFWSLKQQGAKTSRLIVRSRHNNIDLTTFHVKRLTQILDANPGRTIEILKGTWNAEQSEVLATRPYPLKLRLSREFTFQDEGTSFVDALQRRQTSFGWLNIVYGDKGRPFNHANWSRFLRLDVTFEKLTIGCLEGENVLLPFSMKVKALVYELAADDIQLEEFESLAIAAKDLTIEMQITVLQHDENWNRRPIVFLERIAELGHFENFGFVAKSRRNSSTYHGYISRAKVAELAEAFCRVIRGNPNLTQLTLDDHHRDFQWYLHLENIFQALEDHPNLRTFTIGLMMWSGFDFSPLEKLLSRKRDIIVLNFSGEIILNGGSIDRLYALNRFIKGSAKLVSEETVLRPLLAATALINGALPEFQYISILLSDHTDFVCEHINSVNLEPL